MEGIKWRIIQMIEWEKDLTVLTDSGRIYWLWKETDSSKSTWNEIIT